MWLTSNRSKPAIETMACMENNPLTSGQFFKCIQKRKKTKIAVRIKSFKAVFKRLLPGTCNNNDNQKNEGNGCH